MERRGQNRSGQNLIQLIDKPGEWLDFSFAGIHPSLSGSVTERGLCVIADERRAATVQVNPNETQALCSFSYDLLGPAGVILPALQANEIGIEHTVRQIDKSYRELGRDMIDKLIWWLEMVR